MPLFSMVSTGKNDPNIRDDLLLIIGLRIPTIRFIYSSVVACAITSISELSNYISNLDIFVTGDSGPMHIAASLQVPTIAIFGPTNSIETSQWKNANSFIVKKNLDCQPCMKRTCPLKHHNCMKLIEAQEVIESIPLILTS